MVFRDGLKLWFASLHPPWNDSSAKNKLAHTHCDSPRPQKFPSHFDSNKSLFVKLVMAKSVNRLHRNKGRFGVCCVVGVDVLHSLDVLISIHNQWWVEVFHFNFHSIYVNKKTMMMLLSSVAVQCRKTFGSTKKTFGSLWQTPLFCDT